MCKRLCRTWAKDSTWLPRIASVSIESHGAKTVNGWNGQRLTGSFLSTTSAEDSSNLTDGFFWNSIGDRTALHFLHRTLERFFESQGARIIRWKALLAADPNRTAAIQTGLKIAGRAAPPAIRLATRSGCPTTAMRGSEFPIRAIPPEHLLNLCDVFCKMIVEKNTLLPVHRAFVCTMFLSLLRIERGGLQLRNEKIEASVSRCFFLNCSNFTAFTCSRGNNLKMRSSCRP